VFRCFMAMLDRNISTSTLVRWAWPRRKSWWPVHYQRAKLAAAEIARVVGRGSGRGRPLLWRLRPQHACDWPP
jgi:hypothetical protein